MTNRPLPVTIIAAKIFTKVPANRAYCVRFVNYSLHNHDAGITLTETKVCQ